jgi:hypothetical protein
MRAIVGAGRGGGRLPLGGPRIRSCADYHDSEWGSAGPQVSRHISNASASRPSQAGLSWKGRSLIKTPRSCESPSVGFAV